MRFDAARAIEWSATFAFPRSAGSEGERRAASSAAAELGRLGLRVEQAACRGSRLPDLAEPWLGWLGVGAWATGLALATHLGAAWPARLALAFGALLWLRLASAGFGYLGSWPPRIASTNVIAWCDLAPAPAPPVRVVFLTTLQTFDPRRAAVPFWWSTPLIGLLLAGQLVADLTNHRNPFHLPAWAGPLLLGLLGMTIGGRVWWLVRRPGAPGVGDNRTGLALLLELARHWPRGTSARIETTFVAAGGWAGFQAVLRAMARECPGKPTLIVEWLDPGIGPALALVDFRTGRLAASAAADLWIPHRVVPVSWVCRRHWPFRDPAAGACVGYVGMAGSAMAKAPGVDPEALGRAAQLATEVALRWARKNTVSSVGT